MPGAKVLSDGIEEMKDAPGGGYIVTIADPEGFPVNFIYGQAEVKEERKKPTKLLLNDESDKPRQKRFQRFQPGPAEVHKVSTYCPLPFAAGRSCQRHSWATACAPSVRRPRRVSWCYTWESLFVDCLG